MQLRKLLLLLIASTVIGSSAYAKDQQLQTNNQIKSEFVQHNIEFEAVKTNLLATKSHSFSITANYAVVPKSVRLPAKSFNMCKKLMKEVGADNVVRLGNTLRFRIFYKQTGNKLEEKNIVFDAKKEYVVPKKEPGIKRTVDELGGGWCIVFDQIDFKIFHVNH